MTQLNELRARYESFKSRSLKLDMQRGQPSDANFDLSNAMLNAVGPGDTKTASGIEIRNYPGGVAGLAEARELFCKVLGAKPSETMVGNSSSLQLMSNILMWALLRGLKDSPSPWVGNGKPKIIVTVPGYDRHFSLLDALGFEMICVRMTGRGPDLDAIERIVEQDAGVKAILFVPTYSNPTGEIICDEYVRRLAAMKTAAPDFTILADDAYVIHHLGDRAHRPLNLLRACESAGHPNRVYVFGSTSKITFSGAGVAFMGTSVANVAYISKLFGHESIGPNKVEQLRHVKFLNQYPGGIAGLMQAHARLLKPRFDSVLRVLDHELAGSGLAAWTRPEGGYFISLDTARPVADQVVRLAYEADLALTPAGATFPFGKDPMNSNIRIAPSRPSVADLELAAEGLSVCVKLASALFDEKRI